MVVPFWTRRLIYQSASRLACYSANATGAGRGPFGSVGPEPALIRGSPVLPSRKALNKNLRLESGFSDIRTSATVPPLK